MLLRERRELVLGESERVGDALSADELDQVLLKEVKVQRRIEVENLWTTRVSAESQCACALLSGTGGSGSGLRDGVGALGLRGDKVLVVDYIIFAVGTSGLLRPALALAESGA